VVAKQAGASIPTCSTEDGGAKFRKKEWQRIRDQIKAATINQLSTKNYFQLKFSDGKAAKL
jgi:hypothetical protein